MTGQLATRTVLSDLLAALGRACSGRVFLVGEASQVLEGCRPWTDRVYLFAENVEPDEWERALERCRQEFGVRVADEFPGDLIPLPEGFRDRARPAGVFGGLEVRHFDPYSAAFRFIARGDEPDYHVVLTYLRHEWIEIERMHRMLECLLPNFSTQTIQQDPAEFRRKYKGLLQMSARLEPGTVHRPF